MGYFGNPDFVFGNTVEQLEELAAVDRFTVEQNLREAMERIHVLHQHDACALVRLLNNAADLVVDLAGDLLRVVGLGTERTAEERVALIVAEGTRAELLAHAVLHHHRL